MLRNSWCDFSFFWSSSTDLGSICLSGNFIWSAVLLSNTIGSHLEISSLTFSNATSLSIWKRKWLLRWQGNTRKNKHRYRYQIPLWDSIIPLWEFEASQILDHLCYGSKHNTTVLGPIQRYPSPEELKSRRKKNQTCSKIDIVIECTNINGDLLKSK